MCHQQHGLALAGLHQAAAQHGLALVVQIAAGLIQQQHRRVMDHGARHRNGLALTARQDSPRSPMGMS
jgi:hypothetical protein